MWLVVGLGNPGPQYADNRHNIGFQVVDQLLRRARASGLRAKFGAEIGEATIAGERALFCKPMEFMNTSGQAVARTAKFWKIPVDRTVVVHDDLDLPFARLKLGAAGGHGGHNGLRSILADLGSADFARVRIGIGRPAGGGDAADFVLSDFSKAEGKELPFVVQEAADAVEAIVGQGLPFAMNRFNASKNDKHRKKPDGGRADD